MIKQVIMIGGLARSGKDYTSLQLKEALGDDKVVILSLADPLKDIISKTFDISREALEEFKNNPKEYQIHIKEDSLRLFNTDFRKILQRFGTEGAKSIFGENVWTDTMINKIYNLPEEIEYVIIPDFRFKAEYNGMMNNFKVTTLKVLGADGNTGETHSSETELYDFPFHEVLDNSIHDGRLEAQIKKWIKYQRQVKELINNVTE